MSMNIKNDETYQLARELVKLTGESLTGAVTVALRERIERIRGERGAGLAERLVAIGKECASHLGDPHRAAEHGDLLYDEIGLPR